MKSGLYAWYRARHICVSCRSRRAETGYVMCAECRERNKAYQRRRQAEHRAAGKCLYCDAPARPGKVLCERHARYNDEWQKNYNRAHARRAAEVEGEGTP